MTASVNYSVDIASEIGDEEESDEYDNSIGKDISKEKKRKLSDFENNDGILSNEDFQRIRELKVKKDAGSASTQHGFKLPSSDQLRLKRVDAATLKRHIKKKLTKEEKLALIRKGREDRGKYQARSAIKKKKTSSLSNRQKEQKKLMPYAARKAKIARTRQEKKMKQKHSAKQFRGRKAWR